MDRLKPTMHESLSEDVLKSLFKKKINTVLNFLECNTRLIGRTTGLTFKQIHEIRKTLLKKYIPACRNAFDYYRKIITTCAIIPTGIKSLDSMLEGGLYTGNIYEVCGRPSSGKTAFCLTLLCNVLQKTPDNVVYLDTKYDFTATKVKSMITNVAETEVHSMLERLIVMQTISRQEFMNSLFAIKDKLEHGFPLKLLIIDSLPALYNQTFNPTETNSFLNHTANILNYISNQLNVAVIVTNLITLWNEGNFKNTNKFREKIYCGSYWHNVPNVRLHFKREYNVCTIGIRKTFKVIQSVRECQSEFSDRGLQ